MRAGRRTATGVLVAATVLASAPGWAVAQSTTDGGRLLTTPPAPSTAPGGDSSSSGSSGSGSGSSDASSGSSSTGSSSSSSSSSSDRDAGSDRTGRGTSADRGGSEARTELPATGSNLWSMTLAGGALLLAGAGIRLRLGDADGRR